MAATDVSGGPIILPNTGQALLDFQYFNFLQRSWRGPPGLAFATKNEEAIATWLVDHTAVVAFVGADGPPHVFPADMFANSPMGHAPVPPNDRILGYCLGVSIPGKGLVFPFRHCRIGNISHFVVMKELPSVTNLAHMPAADYAILNHSNAAEVLVGGGPGQSVHDLCQIPIPGGGWPPCLATLNVPLPANLRLRTTDGPNVSTHGRIVGAFARTTESWWNERLIAMRGRHPMDISIVNKQKVSGTREFWGTSSGDFGPSSGSTSTPVADPDPANHFLVTAFWPSGSSGGFVYSTHPADNRVFNVIGICASHDSHHNHNHIVNFHGALPFDLNNLPPPAKPEPKPSEKRGRLIDSGDKKGAKGQKSSSSSIPPRRSPRRTDQTTQSQISGEKANGNDFPCPSAPQMIQLVEGERKTIFHDGMMITEDYCPFGDFESSPWTWPDAVCHDGMMVPPSWVP